MNVLWYFQVVAENVVSLYFVKVHWLETLIDFERLVNGKREKRVRERGREREREREKVEQERRNWNFVWLTWFWFNVFTDRSEDFKLSTHKTLPLLLLSLLFFSFSFSLFSLYFSQNSFPLLLTDLLTKNVTRSFSSTFLHAPISFLLFHWRETFNPRLEWRVLSFTLLSDSLSLLPFSLSLSLSLLSFI